MNYQEFLGKVQRLGGFPGGEEARATVANVLMAVAEVLPQDQLNALALKLPPELLVYLRRTRPEPDPYFDSQLFLGWVVSGLDATGARDKSDGGLDLYATYSGDEAIRRCQCVFAVLKSLLEPGENRAMAGGLPDGVDAWFLQA